MAQSIFDKNSLLNKYSLLGQGSPNQMFLQGQKINQGIPPLANPQTTNTANTKSAMTMTPVSRNVKANKTSPSIGNNLLQGVSKFANTDFGTGFTQGLLGASRYSPVPITFGQAFSEAMQAGNQLVTDRATESFRPMTAEEKAMYGITEGNWAMNTATSEPISLDTGEGVNVQINQAGDNELQKLDAKNISTVGTKLDEQATKAQDELNKFARVEALMRNIPEGDFGAFATQRANIKKLLNYDVANLEALNVEFGAFVMGQIQNTKGAVSEREMDYFGEISPTITKTRDGLKLMIDIMKISNKQVIEKNDFYNKWSRDWRENNKDKSVSDLKNDWNIAEKEWDEKNNSILSDQLTKRINQQIINNYEGNFDRSSFDSAQTQNAIRAYERENDFNEGQAVLLEVLGDKQVEVGFYKTTEDGYTFMDTKKVMDF